MHKRLFKFIIVNRIMICSGALPLVVVFLSAACLAKKREAGNLTPDSRRALKSGKQARREEVIR